MAKGSFKSSTGTSLNIICEWSSVADVTKNQSKVTLKLYRQNNSLHIGAREGSTSIAGTSKTFSTASISYSGSALQKVLIASQTLTVKHGSDGTKKITLSETWEPRVTYSGVYIGTISISKTVSLDDIPQTKPTISSAKATDITATSAKAVVTASHSTGIKTYEFTLGSTLKKTSNNYETFTGLTANKDYTITVRVLANNGIYSSQKAITFTTSPILVTSITANNVTLNEKQIETLSYTVNPSTATNKTVKVTSSNENIAYYSNGKVHGLKKGTCYLTIKAQDGSGVSKKIKVTVNSVLQSITPVSSTLNLQVGNEENIEYTYYPTNADVSNIQFSSSNQSVATVDSDGLVTALATGSTTITISQGSVSASVSVKVIEEAIWNDVEYFKTGDRWDYSICKKIQDNLFWIKNKLEEHDYEVDELEYTTYARKYKFYPYNIKNAVNRIESNIDKINAALDWINQYYGSAVSYNSTAPVKENLNRWIDFCYSIYYIIKGEREKSVYLLTDDNLFIKLSTGEYVLIENGGID